MTTENTIPKPRAVIFDWDDTVVNNWDTAVKALNAALVHMGIEAWSDAECRRRSGGSAKDLFSGLFGDRWQEADKVYYETFNALVLDNINIHTHIEDVFKTLYANNVYLAVVSNKRGELLRKEVGHIKFDTYFGNIVGAGDAVADKPDPAPVLMALGESGILPGPDVWFIGDSHTDMMCAHRSGCSGILIETKPPPDDLLINNPPQVRMANHAKLMEFVSAYFA